jgi:hypothetical protein
VVSATTSAPGPQIAFVNNLATGLLFNNIVRLKLAAPPARPFDHTDLLTDDLNAECLPAQGPQISVGQTMSFNQTIGANYSVFIQLGNWYFEPDCPLSIPYTRGPDLLLNLQTTRIYVQVDVTGHSSGTVTFTVSGTYQGGTPSVRVTGLSTPVTIPFTVFHP